jgi:serine/threonine-protein kinase
MTDPGSFARQLGDDFEVSGVIAQPPYARVLAARRAGEPVTVTVVDADVVRQMRDPAAFVAVMRRVATVAHPALAPIVAVGFTAEGAPFYAVTASDAPTGHERIVAGRLPSAQQVADEGSRIADGLEALHGEGLVHGLIEPDRLRFTPEGARLEDAGLYLALAAAGLGDDAILQLARPGVYLSPEQQSGASPDSRSDIYGLGASLYELLTGKPPFGGRTTTMVMASVLADEPAVAVDAENQAPGHVVDAIVRALEKAPDDRWPSAGEFASALSTRHAAQQSASPTPARGGCLPVAMFIVAGAALTFHALSR